MDVILLLEFVYVITIQRSDYDSYSFVKFLDE